jgi:hypothetical protein
VLRAGVVVLVRLLLRSASWDWKGELSTTGTHDGSRERPSSARIGGLLLVRVRDSVQEQKQRKDRAIPVVSQDSSCGRIGLRMRRGSTIRAAAALARAVHVRAKVGKRAGVDGLSRSLALGERAETTSPRATGSAEGPHAIVVLLAPASRSCSKVRHSANTEVRAARPTDT